MAASGTVRLTVGLVVLWVVVYGLIGWDPQIAVPCAPEVRLAQRPCYKGVLSEVGYVSAGVVLTAIGSFLAFLRLGAADRLPDERMRSAIAGSTVLTYLTLVGTAGLFTRGGELPPIASTLLANFTATVGVIIAFYFGSSAYVAGKARAQTAAGTGARTTDAEANADKSA